MKPKKQGFQLDMRTFRGRDHKNYLVFHASGGAFHVFSEVEAKEAARQCGATKAGNTRQMWGEIWAKAAE